MGAKRITKEAEARILRSLEYVGSEVSDGKSPNEAIVKAASESNLTPDQVQLMIYAYNNAKANRMRKSASIVADKVAPFELADPSVIFEELYPNVKTASAKELSMQVSDEYNRPPCIAKPQEDYFFEKSIPFNKFASDVESYNRDVAFSSREADRNHARDKKRLADIRARQAAEPQHSPPPKESGPPPRPSNDMRGPGLTHGYFAHGTGGGRRIDRKALTSTNMPEGVKVGSLDTEPDYYIKRAFNLLKELDNEHDNLRIKIASAQQKSDDAVTDLLGYFQRINSLPFSDVHKVASSFYGLEGDVLFEHLVDINPRLKFTKSSSVVEKVDWSKEPFCLIKQVMDKSAEWSNYQEQLASFSKEASDASSHLVAEFMPLNRKQGSIFIVEEKKANIGLSALSTLGDLGGMPGGSDVVKAITKGVTDTVEPKAQEGLERKSLLATMDPAHDQRLRGIRAQSAIHDLMANDPYLQGTHPDKLAKHYNEIVKLAPHVADQPLLLRALLRRHLAQGLVEPVEVDQLAGIEGKLKGQRDPVGITKVPGEA